MLLKLKITVILMVQRSEKVLDEKISPVRVSVCELRGRSRRILRPRRGLQIEAVAAFLHNRGHPLTGRDGYTL